LEEDEMVRVGLVGFGMAGRVFHAPLISSVEGLELAAVVERHSRQAEERYPEIATHTDLDSMLADRSLGLVVVATPSGSHFEIARQVMEAGHNVLVDKPMAARSHEIAELISVAKRRGVLLAAFHNRRFDGDFLTVQSLVREGALGRLVHMESRMDRWNPRGTRRPWKDDPAQGGGVLLDLGTHLVDLAMALFGKPLGVGAEVLRERDGEGADDAFTVRLRYAGMRVTLEANALSSPPGPRFVVRGTKGNFRKKGVDPQEAALNKITRITSEDWGKEPASEWGMLHVDVDGGMVTRPLETTPGDYRKLYAGVRDAVEGKGKPPVSAQDAWRAARVLEWAVESSESRREIACDWSAEPA
jgi:scyllo-inositol 2-dehydrogenase (NADP+)